MRGKRTMNVDDELRAALEHRREIEDSTAKAHERIDLARKDYERDEASVREELRDSASRTLQMLVASGTAESIEIGPKRRFGAGERAQGWNVHIGRFDYILCTDGTLISTGSATRRTPARRSTLTSWIDVQVLDVRLDRFSEGPGVNVFHEAFRLADVDADSLRARARHQGQLRERLSITRARVMGTLADLLYDAEVPA